MSGGDAMHATRSLPDCPLPSPLLKQTESTNALVRLVQLRPPSQSPTPRRRLHRRLARRRARRRRPRPPPPPPLAAALKCGADLRPRLRRARGRARAAPSRPRRPLLRPRRRPRARRRPPPFSRRPRPRLPLWGSLLRLWLGRAALPCQSPLPSEGPWAAPPDSRSSSCSPSSSGGAGGRGAGGRHSPQLLAPPVSAAERLRGERGAGSPRRRQRQRRPTSRASWSSLGGRREQRELRLHVFTPRRCNVASFNVRAHTYREFARKGAHIKQTPHPRRTCRALEHSYCSFLLWMPWLRRVRIFVLQQTPRARLRSLPGRPPAALCTVPSVRV